MTKRIHSIDAVRGFCLLNIFVNHITLGRLHELSPSKIAFCDSAEVFVLLAGVSAFLAYGPRRGEFDLAAARDRMWRRAMILYLVNLAIVAASFAILYVGGLGAEPASTRLAPQGVLQSAGPLAYLWHSLTMQQSIGLSMVLRLYVILMIVAPAYVWLASKRYWYPLVPAAAVWLVSGHFGLASRDSLTGELLSMTILPWQLVFAAGISLGAAIAQQAPLPHARGLVLAAGAIVAGGTLLLVMGPHTSPAVQAWLDTRNEFFWTGISKSYQSPLRLLYLAALAYLFMAWRGAPLIRLFHKAAPDSLLCRLGRNSLQVFAFGAVFALIIDQLLWNLAAADVFPLRSMGAIALEIVVAGIGLALMSRIADRRRAAGTASPALKPATL